MAALTQAPALEAPALPATRLSSAARSALGDVWPVLIGITPLALAIGVAIGASTVHPVIGWLGAPLVYAGSAHLTVVAMLGAGASAPLAVGAALLVNARFAVYGASLGPLFERQPRWFRLLGPHFIVDQTYALVMGRAERDDPGWMRTYFLTCAGAIAAVWLPAVAAGIILGPVVPADSPLGIAAPLMVAGLLGGALRSPRSMSVALAAFATAIALQPYLGSLTIIAATAAGIAVSRIDAQAWARRAVE